MNEISDHVRAYLKRVGASSAFQMVERVCLTNDIGGVLAEREQFEWFGKQTNGQEAIYLKPIIESLLVVLAQPLDHIEKQRRRTVNDGMNKCRQGLTDVARAVAVSNQAAKLTGVHVRASAVGFAWGGKDVCHFTINEPEPSRGANIDGGPFHAVQTLPMQPSISSAIRTRMGDMLIKVLSSLSVNQVAGEYGMLQNITDAKRAVEEDRLGVGATYTLVRALSVAMWSKAALYTAPGGGPGQLDDQQWLEFGVKEYKWRAGTRPRRLLTP